MTAKVYISGPITGVSEYRRIFSEAEEKLEKVGYRPVNPCKVSALGPQHASSWARNMRGDIRAMAECDGVAYLPDWQKSRGAVIEIELATLLEMPCMSLQDWLAIL